MKITKILWLILMFALLTLMACSHRGEPNSSEEAPTQSEPQSSQSSSTSVPPAADEAQPQEKPQSQSLTVTVNDVDVILVDMSEPLVRSFFSGCNDFDPASLDMVIDAYFDRPEIHGYIDPHYTYPVYTLAENMEDTYTDIAQKLLDGEKLENCIIPFFPRYEGIFFDDSGFPVSVAQFGDNTTGYYNTVMDATASFEMPADQVDAFIGYFSDHILIVTDEMCDELKNRQFDLDKTTVRTGWFDYPAFFFSDGEHELLRINDETLGGYFARGQYVTPQELGKDMLTPSN